MHQSVLLEEVIKYLNIKPNGKYVDATLGYAGHSSEILSRLNEKGFLFAFDQDEEAVKYSYKKLFKISPNFKIFNTNFKNILDNIYEKVDGIIFDLGVSSPQLDDASRGFSYQKDSFLDMRMDYRNPKTAYTVVNTYSLEKLLKIFYEYGNEKYSKKIALSIVNNRPIKTTTELVNIIKQSVPEEYKRLKHPARKIFQAIRIEVNDEISILKKSLLDSFSLLNKKGRLCVITFHSLEDKIVKDLFKSLSEDDSISETLPYVPDELKRKAKLITKKPILPSIEEVNRNNRSRSAKLRIIEKL